MAGITERLCDWLTMKWLQRKSFRNDEIGRMAVHSCDFVGNSINVYGAFEKEYIELITKFLLDLDIGRKTLVDVGANIGNHSLLLGRIFEKVVCVEANPNNFKLLSINCTGHKYFLINKAASSAVGDLIMLEPSVNMGGSRIVGTSDVHDPSIIKVFGEPLDHMLSDFGAVDVIKMDVEGHENEVLLGASETLSSKPIIIFEQNSWDATNGEQRAADLLRKYGFLFLALSSNDPLEPASQVKKMMRFIDRVLRGVKVKVEFFEILPYRTSYANVIAIHRDIYKNNIAKIAAYIA